MTLAKELLEQAEYLLNKEPRKPRQASLRRSVSAAYYALFHLLSGEASRFLVGGKREDRALRLSLRRSFVHADMKRISNAFSRGTAPERWQASCGPSGIPVGLRQVAATFVELQEARHEADYDLAKTYTRQEAKELVRRVRRAFTAWDGVRGTKEAATFLVALLANRRA